MTAHLIFAAFTKRSQVIKRTYIHTPSLTLQDQSLMRKSMVATFGISAVFQIDDPD